MSSASHPVWLESSCDGLLSLDAEKLLLTLPLDVVPGQTALWHPEIINRMTQCGLASQSILSMSDWIRNCDMSLLGHTVRQELIHLKNWFEDNPDCSSLPGRPELGGLIQHDTQPF